MIFLKDQRVHSKTLNAIRSVKRIIVLLSIAKRIIRILTVTSPIRILANMEEKG